MSPLATLFVILAGLSLLGVLLSLVLGVGVMTRGKEGDHKKSNKMMQMRIICQGLCLLFLFLAFAAS
jgi:hypothetical protein